MVYLTTESYWSMECQIGQISLLCVCSKEMYIVTLEPSYRWLVWHHFGMHLVSQKAQKINCNQNGLRGIGFLLRQNFQFFLG